jgi:methylenetetrahydrofolate reductase (NADPH)
MKVTQHIEAANEKPYSPLKLFRHKREKHSELYDNIDPLMEFKPPFIDVTTSREEFIYVDKGNGLLDKKTNQNALEPWDLCFNKT